jgi:hypothetical protein
MGRNAGAQASYKDTTVLRNHWICVYLRIISRWRRRLDSERVQPRQEILVVLPARLHCRSGCYLFKRLTLGLQIGLGVMACRIQMGVSKEIPDDCDVDSRGQEVTGCRMTEEVRGNVFEAQRRCFLGGPLHVVAQFVADPGSPKWTAIAIYEDPLLFVPGLALEQRFQECDGFGPERAHSLLLPLGGHGQLQLMPPGRVKPSGSRIHTIRCSDGSTSSSRTATAGEAIASISTTTPADCERSLPVGPTL